MASGSGSTLLLIATFLTITQVTAEYALLNVKDGSDEVGKEYCLMFNPQFQKLPETLENMKYHPYLNLLPSMLCETPEDPSVLEQKIVQAARGQRNCSFFDRAKIVQDSGGEALVVATKGAVFTPSANESAGEFEAIHIPVAVIAMEDAEAIQALGDNVAAAMYAPLETVKVDYNLILIWVMAVGTVAIGAYWSGLTAHRLEKRRMLRRHHGGLEDGKSDTDDEEEPTMDVNAIMIIVFVVMIITMLLLLYFFYNYVVYIIIALFCLAAAAGIHACLLPLVRKIPIGEYRIPPKEPMCGMQPEIRSIILAFLAIAFCVLWFVFRHEEWSWILQDLMGIAFSIHLLKTIRLPNFKICFILLAVLFVYDIFFVFITPYMTKSGESVMVQVATGGGDAKEQIPIVLKVPRFSYSPYAMCIGVQYSLLGFGDILVPGLLVAYACRFDFKVHSGKIYFIANSVAYAIGLVICFVALLFMETGQPALLYLVPCTVGTTLVIGWRRKELKHLWTGQRETLANQSESDKGDNSRNDESCTNDTNARPDNASNVE
ncbi:signal peptide peptidase-like 2B isoform X2 [Ptychodera flava]|uniref:signal peptide peptidase-like 2B isoform X2 n=1 Tax=Ptychodera flava TaxID=63121 RepID=UPI00396AAACB